MYGSKCPLEECQVVFVLENGRYVQEAWYFGEKMSFLGGNRSRMCERSVFLGANGRKR